MLRVIRNHRRAALRAKASEYEGLSIVPRRDRREDVPRVPASSGARVVGPRAALGEKHGYRNAQVTVIAPTGTIGLLMDCDTTGVEPDFALVKFKKLAGGGYFKIINQSLPPALEKLGYTPAQIDDIVASAIGRKTLAGAPRSTTRRCSRTASTTRALRKVESALARAFELRQRQPRRARRRASARRSASPGAARRLAFDAARAPRLHASTDRRRERLRVRHDDRRGRAAPQATSTCRSSTARTAAAARHALHPVRGARRHDGGGAAVHLRRDQQDDQHAERRRRRTSKRSYRLSWQLDAEGGRALPRRRKLSQPLTSSAEARQRRGGVAVTRARGGRGAHHREGRARYLAKRRRLPHRRAGYTQKAASAATRSTCAPASTRTARSARSSSTCTRRAPRSAA
jgi:ribonucleoside-diphosphate reductase alpha chain